MLADSGNFRSEFEFVMLNLCDASYHKTNKKLTSTFSST